MTGYQFWQGANSQDRLDALRDAGFLVDCAVWLVGKSWTALPRAVQDRLDAFSAVADMD